MEIYEKDVATIRSTQFDKIIGRYPSAIKTYKLLKKYFKSNSRILDYGSGNGIFLRILQRNGHEAYGWEPSQALVDAVNVFQNIKNNSSDIADIENVKFDIILSLRTLAYIPNKEEVIKVWAQMLNEGGILILENSNYKYWERYKTNEPMHSGWNISREVEKEFLKYFILKERLIGFAPYYHGCISDGIVRIILKKFVNFIDRALGKFFSLFAPHYIYIY